MTMKDYARVVGSKVTRRPRATASRNKLDSTNFNVAFGALVPSLAEQLDCKPSDVELLQKDVDAITRLMVRGLISDSVGRAARKRMMSRIAEFLMRRETALAFDAVARTAASQHGSTTRE